jgi:uncharacterized protein
MPDEKLARLEKVLALRFPERKFALAFSGGLDSRFLAFAAQRAGFDVALYHISGPHLPAHETQSAKDWADKHHLPISVFCVNPLENEKVLLNGKDRCYHCKNFVFGFIEKQTDRPLADGTNFSDTQTYRPGLKALEEHGIISPLREAGLLKSEIRRLADRFGLEAAYQPSTTCLLTRFDYGVHPDAVTMHALGEAEKAVRDLLVRRFGNQTALRIRMVDGTPNLHLLSELFAQLSEADKDTVRETFFKAAPFFNKLEIEGLPTLSGFFDRKANNTTP